MHEWMCDASGSCVWTVCVSTSGEGMELRVTRQRKMACVVHIRAWELGASYSSWLIISFSTPCRGGYSSQYRRPSGCPKILSRVVGSVRWLMVMRRVMMRMRLDDVQSQALLNNSSLRLKQQFNYLFDITTISISRFVQNFNLRLMDDASFKIHPD